MGHQLIGPLPRTKEWKEVVGLLAAGASVEQLAIASVHAAQKAFESLHQDPGTRRTMSLLFELPQAARQDDLCLALRDLGLCVPVEPSIIDLAVALTNAIDASLLNNCRRTDLGEMAQLAAAEVLIAHLHEETRSLFGTSPRDIQSELARLYQPARFGSFARRYFTRLVYRVLDYYLGRVLGEQVGDGRRFLTLADARDFQQALQQHCSEAAVVVVGYTSDWIGSRRAVGQSLDTDVIANYTYGAVAKILKVFRLELPEAGHAA